MSATGERIERLERRITELEQQLAAEVRTRRVAVVDADGAERITLEVRDRNAKIEVRTTDDTYVMLLASDFDDVRNAGVWLVGGGNTEGAFRVIDRESDGTVAPGEYLAELQVDQPNALPGLTIDHEGVKLHQMRLYREEEARRRERAGLGHVLT